EDVKRFIELLRHYRALESDLKTLENQMKKLIKGSIKIGGKEIGWVRKRSVEIDIEKLFRTTPNAFDYVLVHWKRKEQLLQEYGEELIKDIKETIEWRL
ncbi:MAG: hypothetical protein ACPLRS_05110, partial [Hydrogenobacter sp.]